MKRRPKYVVKIYFAGMVKMSRGPWSLSKCQRFAAKEARFGSRFYAEIEESE